MLLKHPLDRVGNWNPQLIRELKGRVKGKNLLLVAGASITIQLLLLLFFWGRLPIPPEQAGDIWLNTTYCVSPTGVEKLIEDCAVDWPRWWVDLTETLGFLLRGLLILGGMFVLGSNLLQEEKGGTLSLIRLSPRPFANLYWGKVLGIPALIVGIVLLALPFHAYAMAQAGYGFFDLGRFYGLTVAACLVLYSLNFLLVSLGGVQPWISLGFGGTVLFVWIQNSVNLRLRENYSLSEISWFGIQLGEHIVRFELFVFLSCLILMFGLWQILRRQYYLPEATPMSKGQSYGWVLGLNLWLWGFLYRPDLPKVDFYDLQGSLLLFTTVNLLLLTAIVMAISPQRQQLMDWARYRHQQQFQASSGNRQHRLDRRRMGLWRDLLTGENSPTGLTLVINLLIVGGLWSIFFCLFPMDLDKTSTFAGKTSTNLFISLLLSLGLLLIYGLLMQHLCLNRAGQYPWGRRMLYLLAAIAIPPIVLTTIYHSNERLPSLWMMTVYLSPTFAFEHASRLEAACSILGQWLAIAGLWWSLNRRLHRLGRSELHLLLSTSGKTHP
jgi:hypothetical protein